jgi:TolA-binding protein
VSGDVHRANMFTSIQFWHGSVEHWVQSESLRLQQENAMRCINSMLVSSFFGLLAGCSPMSEPGSSQATVGRPEIGKSTPSDMANNDAMASADEKSASLSDVRQKLNETAQVTGEFSAEQMRNFDKSMRAKVEDLGEQLDELSHRGEELAGDAKRRWQEQVNALEERRKQLQGDIARLQNASGDAWQSLRQGIDNAWTDLQEAVDETKPERSDKPGGDAAGAKSDDNSESN